MSNKRSSTIYNVDTTNTPSTTISKKRPLSHALYSTSTTSTLPPHPLLYLHTLYSTSTTSTLPHALYSTSTLPPLPHRPSQFTPLTTTFKLTSINSSSISWSLSRSSLYSSRLRSRSHNKLQVLLSSRNMASYLP